MILLGGATVWSLAAEFVQLKTDIILTSGAAARAYDGRDGRRRMRNFCSPSSTSSRR